MFYEHHDFDFLISFGLVLTVKVNRLHVVRNLIHEQHRCTGVEDECKRGIFFYLQR